MKRYLIPIMATLVLSSGLLVGCAQSDKASWTEKQVIEYLYGYLMDKARPLQGIYAEAEMILIDWGFDNAISEANTETRKKSDPGDWGELVEMEFNEPLGLLQEPLRPYAFTSALERLAQYQGNRLWLASVGSKEWLVNEATGEVIAKNEEAIKLLEEVTLKTYHNSKYGYYVDYPPSWTIHEESSKQVLIFKGSPEEVKAFFFIGVIEEEELATYKGLQGYIEATLKSLKSQYYEFEVTEASPTRIDYTYMLSEHIPKHEARHYFVEYGSKVYDIVCSAELTKLEGWVDSSLYDPFDSFRFQP